MTKKGIRLNLQNFLKLQGDRTEIEMAKSIDVSRSQLWRIKRGISAVGNEFITKFKNKYPDELFEDYFVFDPICKSSTEKTTYEGKLKEKMSPISE